MRKRTLAIAVRRSRVAGLAAGAFAAGQTTSNPQRTFLNDVAGRLHVTPAQLTGAVRQAMIDQINAAVKAGHLTRSQAAAIKARIEHGNGIPFGGPTFFGPRPGFGLRIPFRGRLQAVPPGMPTPQQVPGPGRFGPPLWPPATVPAAASYLGLTTSQLFKQLQSGRSLAQIAHARGKTTTGLEHAIIASISSRLSQAVKAGRVPRAFERRLLRALTQHVQMIVTMKPRLAGAAGPLRFYLRPGQRPRFPGGGLGFLPRLLFGGGAVQPAPGSSHP